MNPGEPESSAAVGQPTRADTNQVRGGRFNMISIRSKRTRLALVVAAGLAAGAVPGTASASFVSVAPINQPGVGSAPSLLVSGAGNGIGGGSINEPNHILIEDVPGRVNTFKVTDSASPLRASAPHCVQLTANSAQCTGQNVGDTRFYAAFLFGGDDRIEVRSKYLARGGILDGGADNDTFVTPVGADGVSVGGPVRDDIIGGPGIDLLSYAGRPAAPGAPNTGVIVRAGDASLFDDGQFGAEDRVRADVERIVGSVRADSLQAPNQSAGARISGLGGNDVLFGTPNADFLDGGAGVDTLHGLAGNDQLVGRESVNPVRDDLRCGTGSDTALMDTLDASLGCETRQRS
jgi:Ca2+-binding RTX toxin-like protein